MFKKGDVVRVIHCFPVSYEALVDDHDFIADRFERNEDGSYVFYKMVGVVVASSRKEVYTVRFKCGSLVNFDLEWLEGLSSLEQLAFQAS